MNKPTLIRWVFKPLIFLLCLIPFGLLALDVLNQDLGANPLETVLHHTGEWALRFLLITLATTPLRNWTGIAELIRFRRMLGLYAFFYASLHFLIWLFLDLELRWDLIGEAIVERPFITVGFAAWLLLVPLAVTSLRWFMRRMGPRWKMLHRLVYVIGVLGVLHFVWLVKADLAEPLIYAAFLALMLGARVKLARLRGLA